MSLFDKLLGTAQRYAQQNPDKVRGITDRAARFADKQTKGKYRNQIDTAVRKVDGMTGGGRRPDGPQPGGPQQYGPPQYGSPPRPDDVQGPHRDGPPAR